MFVFDTVHLIAYDDDVPLDTELSPFLFRIYVAKILSLFVFIPNDNYSPTHEKLIIVHFSRIV